MTPEEIAKEIEQTCYDCGEFGFAINNTASFDVAECATIIHAAIEAEREACAKLVEDHWPTGRASDMDTIAAAIRARSRSVAQELSPKKPDERA